MTWTVGFRRRSIVLSACLVLALMTMVQFRPTIAFAAPATINFDDVTAPCSFSETVPLTNQYSAQGVTFSGPGAGLGGALINECGSFGVSGQSSPNFLGFNTNGYGTGPETITFSTPTDGVSILAGSRYSGEVTLTAYDGVTQVGQKMLTLSTTMTSLSVSATSISSVVISFTSTTLVVDDLTLGANAPGDTEAPVVTVPANITVSNDPGQNGAIVTFSASASDNVDGSITPDCSPASGSFFPIGTTTVTCTATDSADNIGDASFDVTVNDVEAPAVTVPANITVNATGPNGAVVTFTASASDNTGSTTVACVPPSGSTFAVGTTTVTCTATDDADNQSSGSFTVTVIGADDLLQGLRSMTIDLVNNSSAENALVATVDQLIQAEAKGDLKGFYVAMLKFTFQLNEYQKKGMISASVAHQLGTQLRLVYNATF